jgi:enoyl-CoA hydratase/carnithine racemase
MNAGVERFGSIGPTSAMFSDEAFLSELLMVAEASSREETVRVALLRLTSPMFCAGADLNEWAEVSPRQAQR